MHGHRFIFGLFASLASLIALASAALAAPIAAFRRAVDIAFTAPSARERLELPPAPVAVVGYAETRAFQRRRAERVNRRAFVAGGGAVGVGLAFA